MFRRSDDFPFTRLLEDSWRDVLDEYRNVAARMDAWPETQYYKGDWGTFGLYAFGHKQAANCAVCPRTTREQRFFRPFELSHGEPRVTRSRSN